MKLREKRLAFIDVETTGLDPTVQELIEFAVVFSDGASETFKVSPRHIEAAQPKALEVNGWSAAEWRDAIEPRMAAERIVNALKDCIVIGHNVKFDLSFIRALLVREGVVAVIDRHAGDTMTLAIEHLVPRGLDSLSLRHVCLFLGIAPEPDVHRAEAGARACKAVWDALVAGKVPSSCG